MYKPYMHTITRIGYNKSYDEKGGKLTSNLPP
ncbi:hypothetical protein IX324_002330 [Bacteroides pyogenes]|nr:hypothetical protein [Bacteroides pyogenes]